MGMLAEMADPGMKAAAASTGKAKEWAEAHPAGRDPGDMT